MQAVVNEVLHGLPSEVIFCKKCVISNQRPSTQREFKKQNTQIETVGFGEDGICDTCKWFEYKNSKINWDQREKELMDLCDRFRRKDGRFDVIVPASGGKDSIYVAFMLKHKYNMNPLTVTWAPHMYTEVGWRNLNHMIDSGLDNLKITPNGKVHRMLTRLAFENLVNPFQPFIIGQKNVAPRAALQYDVPLIMYGENQAEAHNRFEENLTPLMDISHFSAKSHNEDLYFGGVHMSELGQYGIQQNELFYYKPLLEDQIRSKKVEVHYFSYYKNWSPQENYYYAKENTGFESNPDGRSEGTYSKFASLDDRIDGQHYYTMFIKFGQGRAMNDANRDIRDGFISREEAVDLVNKYDGEFPKKYFNDVLEYIGISEERYWEVIDKARSPHLWNHSDGSWKLRHPTH